jgi:hypothetical protein
MQMTIGFWLAAASGCGALGALIGVRLCGTRRTWALLDWWWALAGVALIGAVAGGLADIHKLEQQAFAASRISAAERTLYADALRTEQSECGEPLVQHGGQVSQLCVSVDAVLRETVGPRMSGVDAIALAGELDDACPDRCDTKTVALRDDLKAYAATVSEMAPLMLQLNVGNIAEKERVFDALLVTLCLSLGMLCLRLAVAWRRAGTALSHKRDGDVRSTTVNDDRGEAESARMFPAATAKP